MKYKVKAMTRVNGINVFISHFRIVHSATRTPIFESLERT